MEGCGLERGRGGGPGYVDCGQQGEKVSIAGGEGAGHHCHARYQST